LGANDADFDTRAQLQKLGARIISGLDVKLMPTLRVNAQREVRGLAAERGDVMLFATTLGSNDLRSGASEYRCLVEAN
jgi:hypothetical protein